VSEDFTNDAVAGSGTFFSRTGGTSTAVTSMTVHYDAAAQSYTLTMPGHAFTFGPADIKDSPDPAFTVYQAIDNSAGLGAVETLLLLKNRPSTYRYVGAGLWTRYQNGTAGSVFTRFDAFTYGVETPDAALPRTGTASYTVDIAGTIHSGYGFDIGPGGGFDHEARFLGSGNLAVSFATGTLLLTGSGSAFDQYTGTSFGGVMAIGGTGKLSATANNFHGDLTIGANYSGSWLGRFYGPAAEEVGATFFANGPGSFPDSSITGAIVGKRGAISAGTIVPSYSDLGGFAPGANPALGAIAPTGPGPAATLAVPGATRPAFPAAQPDGIPRLPRDLDFPSREKD
jgi:hypothetical protein